MIELQLDGRDLCSAIRSYATACYWKYTISNNVRTCRPWTRTGTQTDQLHLDSNTTNPCPAPPNINSRSHPRVRGGRARGPRRLSLSSHRGRRESISVRNPFTSTAPHPPYLPPPHNPIAHRLPFRPPAAPRRGAVQRGVMGWERRWMRMGRTRCAGMGMIAIVIERRGIV